jgi:hypothetical protein
MHFIIATFVIIGLIGGAMLVMDEKLDLLGLHRSAIIVSKFKQEEEAFAQFCKKQCERDSSPIVSSVQVQQGEVKNNQAAKATQNTAVPARVPAAKPASSQSLFGNTASGVTFDQHPFGNNDFHNLGEVHPSQPASQAPAGPVAQTANADSDGNTSQAQKMKTSSNPIIKTWAGYVSQIEDAEK